MEKTITFIAEAKKRELRAKKKEYSLAQIIPEQEAKEMRENKPAPGKEKVMNPGLRG